ncbi:MAG TPA: hypothetical protein GX507_04810 [Clostridia bacterium]|nr:hypothetical protein [Clostridia bacterium]
MGAPKSGFFPIKRGEAIVLSVLIVLAAIFFLPSFRTSYWGGMVAFGWLMGLYMFFAPALQLINLVFGEKSHHTT